MNRFWCHFNKWPAGQGTNR